MSAAEQITQQLKAFEARHVALSQKVLENLEAANAKVETRGAAIVANTAELKALAAQMTAVQSKLNALREAQDALELEGRGSDGKTRSREQVLGVAALLVASADYKAFADKPKLHRGVPPQKVGSIFAREAAARRCAPTLATRSTDEDSAALPLTKPDFRDEVVLFPKNQPILRTLCTVMTTDSNKVVVDREVVEYAWIAEVTAEVLAGNAQLTLSCTTGVSASAPFNKLTLHGFAAGTSNPATEEVEIQSIDSKTQLTLTANTTIDLELGQDPCHFASAANSVCVPEGECKPQSKDETEEVEYEVCKIADWVKATTELLTDSARARRLIDNRLLSRLARKADKNMFYGPGGSKQITGIFTDTDVPTFDWNTGIGLPAGLTKIDHLIRTFYEGALQNYLFTTVVLHPTDHRDLSLTKGADGHYIFMGVQTEGGPMRLYSMQLLWSNQLEKVSTDSGGDFVMGDFARACVIFDRETDTIDVGLVDDDFIKNKRTILAEMRFAFAIEEPLALAKGTFVAQPT